MFCYQCKYITPLQCFYINCHGVEFHLQLLYLVWCANYWGLKAYNGILLGGEISFFFLYIGSSMFQAFAGYTDDWTEDDFGFSFNPYCYYASWAIGVICAALYIITFIMYVCWGLIPASRYGFSTGFCERPPFKFGCLVFDKSQVDHNCEDNKDIDLESMQHSTSNNTGTKQNEVENKNQLCSKY